MDAAPDLHDVVKRAAPRVLGALVRRSGDFEACEDAVQEALLEASRSWPVRGIPDDPTAWLITVAHRRLVDQYRSNLARARREKKLARLSLREAEASDPVADADDTLTLMFLCCHPSLSPTSQVALTLRAVGGLTTAQIARAYFVSETSMAQRISRGKATIGRSNQPFRMAPDERGERLRAVQHVLYLIFNEGYLATDGPELQTRSLAAESIRLARLLASLVPDDGETVGLLALLLLVNSRQDARTRADGSLVPLREQDRNLWRRDDICEGIELISHSLATTRLGPYQVQAAIAALHAEAGTWAATDWPQILALYDVLEGTWPSPVGALGRVVAHAMVHGADAGLARLALVDDDRRLSSHHRRHAVRAHLRSMVGDDDRATADYLTAADLAENQAEKRYLHDRAGASAADAARRGGGHCAAEDPFIE